MRNKLFVHSVLLLAMMAAIMFGDRVLGEPLYKVIIGMCAGYQIGSWVYKFGDWILGAQK